MSDYKTQSADTDPEVEKILFERLRDLPTWRKAEMIVAITRAAEEMTFAGLRSRYPEASAEELRLRFGALHFDRETMMQVFGWDPVEKGY